MFLIYFLKSRPNGLKQHFFWLNQIPILFFYIIFYNMFSQQIFVGLQDVLKTSSRYILKMSSTRLRRNNFSSSKTSWRRLEDFLQRCLGRRKIVMLKTSWRCLEDMSWSQALNTSRRHVLKTSSRGLGVKQIDYWRYLYLVNLNLYLTNLYFTNLYLTNLSRILSALIRTQQFRYSSYFETEAAFLFQELNLWNWWLNKWGNKNEFLSNILHKYI